MFKFGFNLINLKPGYKCVLLIGIKCWGVLQYKSSLCCKLRTTFLVELISRISRSPSRTVHKVVNQLMVGLQGGMDENKRGSRKT